MKRSLPLAALAGILVAFPLSAQEAPIPISLAAYYRCDQGREARADTIIRQTFAPILDRQVEAGRLTGWGWYSHRMGTDWRRLLFTTGTDRDAMLDARGEMIQELGQRQHVQAVQELGIICPSHDDYMWTTVVNNAGSGQAGPAMSLAMYFVCEIPRQELADDLFRQFVAPIFDRHVERGTIRGYAWLAHRMGGKVRRLLTMAAADTKSLLNAQDAIYEDVEQEASRAQAEIDVICGPHDDYIWNQTIVRP